MTIDCLPVNSHTAIVALLKAIHTQEELEAARDNGTDVVRKLGGTWLPKAAAIVRDGLEEILTYMQSPDGAPATRTNNPLEPARAASDWPTEIYVMRRYGDMDDPDVPEEVSTY